jgi:hypothetical protein
MNAGKWVVTRVGSEGWGLIHLDQFGGIAQVPPRNDVTGDTIEQCREYFAACGLTHDLFYEPTRVYQMFPASRSRA